MIELIIDLDNGETYINNYNKNKLSESLYNYILDEIKGFSIKDKIRLKVFANYELTNDEKKNFVEMIKSNFSADIQEEHIMSKFLYLKSFLLIIIGIVGILLAYLLGNYNIGVIEELFLIIGWVGIWEGIYIILFDEFAKKIAKEKGMDSLNKYVKLIFKNTNKIRE